MFKIALGNRLGLNLSHQRLKHCVENKMLNIIVIIVIGHVFCNCHSRSADNAKLYVGNYFAVKVVFSSYIIMQLIKKTHDHEMELYNAQKARLVI